MPGPRWYHYLFDFADALRLADDRGTGLPVGLPCTTTINSGTRLPCAKAGPALLRAILNPRDHECGGKVARSISPGWCFAAAAGEVLMLRLAGSNQARVITTKHAKPPIARASILSVGSSNADRSVNDLADSVCHCPADATWGRSVGVRVQ